MILSEYETFLRFLKYTGLPTIGISAFWIYIIYKIYQEPEKIEKWTSIINRLFSWVNIEYEKRGVAGDIQADIRKTSRIINSQVPKKILPYGIKIKWVSEENREIFVKDKKVVIRMDHHRNQAKNFMHATLGYAEFGLIPNARDLIEENITRAIELIFSKKIFIDNKKYDVNQIFHDKILNPEIQVNSNLERYCKIFDELERKGQFTRITLKEFSYLDDILPSDIPRRKIINDTIRFTDMLERLAEKEPGTDVNPSYNGEVIKCSVVLIARPETYAWRGLEPYIDFVNREINRGIKTFYFYAFGMLNIIIAKKLADAYGESKDLDIILSDEYKIGRKLEAVCIMLVRK